MGYSCQGLSYWETEGGQRSYNLKFNFEVNDLREEAMAGIQCKLETTADEVHNYF